MCKASLKCKYKSDAGLTKTTVLLRCSRGNWRCARLIRTHAALLSNCASLLHRVALLIEFYAPVSRAHRI
jgi:hypothetical protein